MPLTLERKYELAKDRARCAERRLNWSFDTNEKLKAELAQTKALLAVAEDNGIVRDHYKRRTQELQAEITKVRVNPFQVQS